MIHILPLALILHAGSPTTDWVREQGTFRDTRGPRDFVVDSAQSGKVTKLAWNGRNILAYTFGEFRPAPQYLWPGGWPPPAQWITNPYRPTLTPGRLHLEGQVDNQKRQPVKNYSFDIRDSAFVIDYVVRNTASDSARHVSPWEIVRLPGGTMQFFPKGQNLAGLTSGFTPDREDSIVWVLDNGTRNGELLYRDGAEGWMAAVVDSVLLVKVWQNVPLALIPPEQGEVQVYLSQSPVFQEMENMGPWTAIAPRDSLVWSVRWYLRSIPSGVSKAMGSPDLVRMARQVAGGTTALARWGRPSVTKASSYVDVEGRVVRPWVPGNPVVKLTPAFPVP
jgi:hypothetical protein